MFAVLLFAGVFVKNISISTLVKLARVLLKSLEWNFAILFAQTAWAENGHVFFIALDCQDLHVYTI